MAAAARLYQGAFKKPAMNSEEFLAADCAITSCYRHSCCYCRNPSQTVQSELKLVVEARTTIEAGW